MTDRDAPELKALLVSREAAEQLADDLYVNSHFHEGEPNPTATLMRKGAEIIRRLAAAEECLRSRNCDDLCLVHIQRAEAVETALEHERMKVAGCSTAALGYWKEGDPLAADYECVAIHDVANLYQKYVAAKTALQSALEALRHARPFVIDAGDGEDREVRLRAIATLREIDKAIKP